MGSNGIRTVRTDHSSAPSRGAPGNSLRVDQGRQLKFPETFIMTTLRPELVLVSETMKEVVPLKLTVPWEDWMEKAFKRKMARFEGRARECQSRGLEYLKSPH